MSANNPSNGSSEDHGTQNKDEGKPTSLSAEEKAALLDVLPVMERIVHLDLKGAAPKISYIEKLFPLLKLLGATGLLIGNVDSLVKWQ